MMNTLRLQLRFLLPLAHHPLHRRLPGAAGGRPAGAALVRARPQPARRAGHQHARRLDRRGAAGRPREPPADAVQPRRAGRAAGRDRPVRHRRQAAAPFGGVPGRPHLQGRPGHRRTARPAHAHRGRAGACRRVRGVGRRQAACRRPGAAAGPQLHRAAQPGHAALPDRAHRRARTGDRGHRRHRGADHLARLDRRRARAAARRGAAAAVVGAARRPAARAGAVRRRAAHPAARPGGRIPPLARPRDAVGSEAPALAAAHAAARRPADRGVEPRALHP